MNEELIIRYLQGDATNAERDEVEQWRQQAKENEQSFMELKLLWDASPGLSINLGINANQALERVHGRMKNKTFFGTLKPISRIAALFILVCGTLLLGLLLGKGKNTLYTATNEPISITLDDGSRVWLNRNSSLALEKGFHKKHRRVILSGDAYFEVQKNADLPFSIDCMESEIIVKGTAFNVLSGDSSVIVTVSEGHVVFTAQADSTDLFIGDQASFNRISKNILKQPANPNLLAWKTGEFHFNNSSLHAVANDLSSIFDTLVIINSQVPDSIRINAVFNDEKLAAILKNIVFAVDLTVTKKEKSYVISVPE